MSRVFISWSGSRSKLVAEHLSIWLKCVLQASRPWISTQDIDRGALWFSEISDQLRETSIGVVCLTEENKNRPWILFEAGALAKGLNTSRVCTFLVDLQAKDIDDPLAQFNHTLPDRDGIWKLVKSINAALAVNGLEETTLGEVFKVYWPHFEEGFARCLEESKQSEIEVKPRAQGDLLSDILDSTRSIAVRMRRIEADFDVIRGTGRPSPRFDIKPRGVLDMLNPDEAIDRIRTFKARGLSDREIVDRLDGLVPERFLKRALIEYRAEDNPTDNSLSELGLITSPKEGEF